MADDKKETVEVDNRPTSQKDLEARLDAGFLPDSVRQENTGDDWRNPEVVQASHVLPGNDTSAYRGVSPEYMNYANESEKPYDFEGAEGESVKLLESGVANVRKTLPVDNEPAETVGVGRVQTVNTATSGEGFSAGLVDAPADYNGGPPVLGLESDTPATEATPAKPKATKSAAPAAKSSNS